MSSSMPPRLTRHCPRKRFFSRSSLRKQVFELLFREFEGRCVYSGVHWRRVGRTGLEVEHYDPRRKQKSRQDYRNLLLATGHCNRSKGDFWPSRAERALGLYVINPSAELDYGHHIFEDPASHRLWGATATGRWHIRVLGLNAEHLITERRDAATIRRLWKELGPVRCQGAGFGGLSESLGDLRSVVEACVPEWPHHEAPEGYRFIP